MEEESIAVAPLQGISERDDLWISQRVKVLWDNRKEYSAIFLLSGNIRILKTHVCALHGFRIIPYLNY